MSALHPSRGSAGSWAHDLPASVVVFLVALPLSMGIALASGAPIVAGLVAAVIGGIVVGSLAGAPLQVSGPAAGLAVLVFGYVEQIGFAAVCTMVAVAGLIQIVLGQRKVARLALAVSPAVLHGMLAGIGIQIVLAQLQVAAGFTPLGTTLGNLRALPGRMIDRSQGAALAAVVTVGVMLLWPRVAALKKLPVPAPLVAVLCGTLAIVLPGLVAPRVTIPKDLWSAIVHPAVPTTLTEWQTLLIGAVTIALVASAESLLCAVATDQLHSGSRANLDRELLAQGVGNLLSGLLGGLPITGVIVRSTANIEAGAKGRWSAVFHGVWVLVAVLLLSRVLGLVPLGALAGLLIVVGVRLVNPGHIRDVRRHRELPVYLATVGGVVFVGLLAGIGLGVATALLQLVWRLAKVDIKVRQVGEKHMVDIEGALTFLTVPKLSAALAALPPGSHVDIDLNLTLVDQAALEALHAWKKSHQRSGGKVTIDETAEWTSPRKAVA